MEATEGQLVLGERAQGLQAATPARLFPRFRRLKRSSAATHMPTVGRPGQHRAHEMGEKWGLAGKLLFGFLPSHEACPV